MIAVDDTTIVSDIETLTSGERDRWSNESPYVYPNYTIPLSSFGLQSANLPQAKVYGVISCGIDVDYLKFLGATFVQGLVIDLRFCGGLLNMQENSVVKRDEHRIGTQTSTLSGNLSIGDLAGYTVSMENILQNLPKVGNFQILSDNLKVQAKYQQEVTSEMISRFASAPEMDGKTIILLLPHLLLYEQQITKLVNHLLLLVNDELQSLKQAKVCVDLAKNARIDMRLIELTGRRAKRYLIDKPKRYRTKQIRRFLGSDILLMSNVTKGKSDAL